MGRERRLHHHASNLSMDIVSILEDNPWTSDKEFERITGLRPELLSLKLNELTDSNLIIGKRLVPGEKHFIRAEDLEKYPTPAIDIVRLSDLIEIARAFEEGFDAVEMEGATLLKGEIVLMYLRFLMKQGMVLYIGEHCKFFERKTKIAMKYVSERVSKIQRKHSGLQKEEDDFFLLVHLLKTEYGIDTDAEYLAEILDFAADDFKSLSRRSEVQEHRFTNGHEQGS